MAQQNIDNQKLIEQLKNRDRTVRLLDKSGKFRIAVTRNTNTALNAQKRHNLPPLPAFLLGRQLAASSLMASFLKGEERIIIETFGQGPVSLLYSESLQLGEVRGYADFDHEINTMHFEQLSDVLGEGQMKITRILYNKSEPLQSVVNLEKGDIATDLAYYFAQSEQIPTAVILDTDVDDQGIIRQSGGMLVQALPGADESELQEIYDKIVEIKSLVSYYDKGYTPDKLAREVIPLELEVVASTQVDFFCRCSKDTFLNKMMTLDIDEVRDMQAQGQDELVCMYCNEKYKIEADDFEKIITDIQKQKN